MPVVAITITNDGFNLLRNGIAGKDNPKITYVAIGTGNSTPSVTQHTLDTETFRKAVTSYTDGATGEETIAMYLAFNDYINGDIEEIAFFGGTTASSSLNSGVMFARGLYAHNPKLGTESIQIQTDNVFSQI